MDKLNRKWMYERLEGRLLKKEFTIGVRGFIEFAKQHRDFQESSKIRCPCSKCKNVPFLDVESVREHLYKKGFLNDYYEWVCHGEDFDSLKASDEPSDPYVDMIIDAFGQVDGDPMHEDIRNVEEEPNPQVKKFFEMLAAAQKPLYEGSRLSVLEMASRITSLKCEYNLPHRCVDSISSLISEVIPDENSMSKTYYDTKNVVKGLELPHEKIHACPKGCMLFWKDKAHLEKCSKCGGSVIRRKCCTTFRSRQGCKGSMRPKTLHMKCSGIHKILG